MINILSMLKWICSFAMKKFAFHQTDTQYQLSRTIKTFALTVWDKPEYAKAESVTDKQHTVSKQKCKE